MGTVPEVLDTNLEFEAHQMTTREFSVSYPQRNRRSGMYRVLAQIEVPNAGTSTVVPYARPLLFREQVLRRDLPFLGCAPVGGRRNTPCVS